MGITPGDFPHFLSYHLEAQQDGHLWSLVQRAVARAIDETDPQLCLEGPGFQVSLPALQPRL